MKFTKGLRCCAVNDVYVRTKVLRLLVKFT